MDLLARKRREGVDVEVIVPGDKDDVKAALVAQRRTYRRLLHAGIGLWEYQPVMMHAKTIVIDDHLAVVGSINMNALSFTSLEESAVVIEDPVFNAELAASWETDRQRCHQVLRPKRTISLRRWP